MRISDKVLHLRRLGMEYAKIVERLGVNLWMAKRGTHLGKAHQEKRKSPSHEEGGGMNSGLLQPHDIIY
jgi:hypothetical protein